MIDIPDIKLRVDQALKTLKDNHEEFKIAIYPNGRIAGWIVFYLENEKNINVSCVIDNINYDGKRVLSLEQAKSVDHTNTFFLICSDNAVYFQEIRDAIYGAFDKRFIIDLFGDAHVELPADDDIIKVLDHTEQYMNGMVSSLC